MHLNILSGTPKWVTKMTSKARAALEEKATGTSKKRKPDESGLNVMEQLKKAKTHPAAGNTPTSPSLTAASKGPVTSSMESSKSTTPTAATSRRAVVRTEEEENSLYADEVESDAKDSESGSQSDKSELESQPVTAEDQLSMFKTK